MPAATSSARRSSPPASPPPSPPDQGPQLPDAEVAARPKRPSLTRFGSSFWQAPRGPARSPDQDAAASAGTQTLASAGTQTLASAGAQALPPVDTQTQTLASAGTQALPTSGMQHLAIAGIKLPAPVPRRAQARQFARPQPRLAGAGPASPPPDFLSPAPAATLTDVSRAQNAVLGLRLLVPAHLLRQPRSAEEVLAALTLQDVLDLHQVFRRRSPRFFLVYLGLKSALDTVPAGWPAYASVAAELVPFHRALPCDTLLALIERAQYPTRTSSRGRSPGPAEPQSRPRVAVPWLQPSRLAQRHVSQLLQLPIAPLLQAGCAKENTEELRQPMAEAYVVLASGIQRVLQRLDEILFATEHCLQPFGQRPQAEGPLDAALTSHLLQLRPLQRKLFAELDAMVDVLQAQVQAISVELSAGRRTLREARLGAFLVLHLPCPVFCGRRLETRVPATAKHLLDLQAAVSEALDTTLVEIREVRATLLNAGANLPRACGRSAIRAEAGPRAAGLP